MKNRRIAITAFLLIATLVMGIGFATVTGQLNIMGTAKYNSFAETSSDVHTAVKFVEVKNVTNCTAKITDTAMGDTANIIIAFNDADEDANTFTASATYVIAYESTDTTLPAVTFSDPTPSNDNPKFVVTFSWKDSDKTVAPHATDAPVDTVELTVTVTYAAEANETGVQNAIITIPLPYASVTATP